MLKTLRLLVVTAAIGTVIVVGCGDDDKNTGANLPPRNSGKDAETNTSTSGGSSGNTDPNYDCSNRAAVDDDPACDQCARSKCCEWITKCDGSPSCKAAQECIAACDDGDIICVQSCAATGGTGAVFLQEFGACVSNECKTECQSAQPEDAGFDSPF